MISNCNTNFDEHNQQPTEPHEVPEIPWTKIWHKHFWTLQKKPVWLLLIITAFLNIHSFTDKQPSSIIMHHKRMFPKFGIPQSVLSDNGSEFKANKFKIFAKEWDFKRDSYSARYP